MRARNAVCNPSLLSPAQPQSLAPCAFHTTSHLAPREEKRSEMLGEGERLLSQWKRCSLLIIFIAIRQAGYSSFQSCLQQACCSPWFSSSVAASFHRVNACLLSNRLSCSRTLNATTSTPSTCATSSTRHVCCQLLVLSMSYPGCHF